MWKISYLMKCRAAVEIHNYPRSDGLEFGGWHRREIKSSCLLCSQERLERSGSVAKSTVGKPLYRVWIKGLRMGSVVWQGEWSRWGCLEIMWTRRSSAITLLKGSGGKEHPCGRPTASQDVRVGNWLPSVGPEGHQFLESRQISPLSPEEMTA